MLMMVVPLLLDFPIMSVEGTWPQFMYRQGRDNTTHAYVRSPSIGLSTGNDLCGSRTSYQWARFLLLKVPLETAGNNGEA